MTNFFSDKINAIRNWRFAKIFFACIVIALVSFLTINKTFGKLSIGGDTFLPIFPEFSYKLGYEWVDTANGQYISNTYRVWISIFSALKFVGLDIYQAAFAFELFILFFSGLGIYRLYNLFNEDSPLYGVLPAFFFILSPHLLENMIYNLGTVSIVWIGYFLIKFLKNKTFAAFDVVSICVLLGMITDLPNPKHHFILMIMFVIAIVFGMLLRIIDWKTVKANLVHFIYILLISAYLLFPVLFFAFSFFKHNPVPINVKLGYEATGETLDFKLASIDKMMRLFHTPNLGTVGYEKINQPLFFFSYYIIPIIVLGLAPFVIYMTRNKMRRYYLLYLMLAVIFVLLSKSSNPPFGYLYEMSLSIKPLAFLRTSVGIVIYAAVFFALLLGLVFQHVHMNIRYKKTVMIFFLLLIGLVGYPYWSGLRFINTWAEQTMKNKNDKYGLRIPEDYFDSAKVLRNLRLDTKIDVYPYAVNYQSNSWGYFGYIMYPWVYYQPTISFNKGTVDGSLRSKTNARYVLHDKTLVGFAEDYSKILDSTNKSVYTSEKLTVYRKPDSDFLPHFFIANKNVVTDHIPKSYADSKTALPMGFFSLKNPPDLLKLLPESTKNKPSIEYRKISPSKYRVIVHGAKDIFPIIFTENYNPEWKLYLGNMESYEKKVLTEGYKNANLSAMYKSFAYNESDQASINEVRIFTQQNLISVPNISEEEPLEFVSKNFHGSIQNDNLLSNNFYETVFYKELKNAHMLVNYNFNSWIINPVQICSDSTSCRQNPDGSYEIEFVAEFWPQKLADFSLTFSILAAFIYLCHRAFVRKKNSTR